MNDHFLWMQNLLNLLTVIVIVIVIIYMGNQESYRDSTHSVPIAGSKQVGFSQTYRNSSNPNVILTTPNPNMKSIKDVIYHSFRKNQNKDFLAKIKLKPVKQDNKMVEDRQLIKYTYKQIFNMAEMLGSFLVSNKMDHHQSIHDMKLIGIFSKNRYEWVVADMACMLYGLTLVPLYETLGVDNLTYCLEHSGITTLFVTQQTIKTVLGLKGHGNLQNLICLDILSPQIQQQLRSHKFKVFYFQNVIKWNQFVDHGQIQVNEKNCLTFSYTSGTTGPPKGAMISHGNFLGLIATLKNHQLNGFSPDDVYVSFLPLPHIMQRAVIVALMYIGAFVAFYNGDITKFKDDLAFIKPTILIAVPRLYNRIVQGVQKQIQQVTGIKGCLVNNGIKTKIEQMQSSGSYTSTIYDSLVFSKIREKFGGKIRLMITGSAPIKKQTYEFMKVIMCCPFYEGYGQTQATAASFLNRKIDSQAGHVGGVVGSLEFKLNDIPEMHYTSEDKDEQGRSTPRGQIWVRGSTVFMGYYKDNQKTNEVLTSDGWLKTGDVGMILPGSNDLKIIDRRKNIFKLQQGQYIAAEKVQNIYTKSNLVSQVFLYGESTQNFCVAIVLPDKQQLQKIATRNSINGQYSQIVNSLPIRTLICKQLDSVGKRSGLMSFEQAKNVYCETQPFAARGLVSSTMKLQRFAAKKHYLNQIQAMYKEGQLEIK